MPLGTGNDLSRVLGWGAKFDDESQLPIIMEQLEHAQIKTLDRWSWPLCLITGMDLVWFEFDDEVILLILLFVCYSSDVEMLNLAFNSLMFTQRRSIAKTTGCFQRRLFVCLFVNTITTQRVNIGWWNLVGRCIVRKSLPSSNLGVIALPWVRTPKNVALGYDVEKFSAGCLVLVLHQAQLQATWVNTNLNPHFSPPQLSLLRLL